MAAGHWMAVVVNPLCMAAGHVVCALVCAEMFSGSSISGHSFSPLVCGVCGGGGNGGMVIAASFCLVGATILEW